MFNETDIQETFFKLVQIDSETGHEETIQPILKEIFTDLGMHVVEDQAAQHDGLGANNLICTLPATHGYEQKDKIYFTCHMDTVAPGLNIQPQLKDDGYIYSDGTTILGADDKAGLAALIESIKHIQAENTPHGQIQLVITVGEESGLLGARHLDDSLLDADYGYAIDANAPVGTTVIGAPTQLQVEALIHGRTAHASTPGEGISAINIAAKAVSRMTLGQVDEETTANIGRFMGGTATNVVADNVTIQAEARSHNYEKVYAQAEHMKTVFETVAEEAGGTADVQITESYKGFNVAENAPVVTLASQSASALGLDHPCIISGGGSDASIINHFGIPSVILGVGYEHIHTTSERIALTSLVKLTEHVTTIIKIAAR